MIDHFYNITEEQGGKQKGPLYGIDNTQFRVGVKQSNVTKKDI